MSYKNFPLAIFLYSPAVVALYHCATIHSLSFSNKLSTEVGVLGLSRFFVFLSAQKFARLYLKNYTSYAREFSYSPITFAVVSESGETSQLGVMVRGLQCPPKRSQSTKFQNFQFFAWPLCQNALSQRFRTGFILHPTAPASERPYQFEGGPLTFGPRPPWAAHPQKSFSQISQKS